MIRPLDINVHLSSEVILHVNILCWLRPSFGYRFLTSFALEIILSAIDTVCQIKCYRIPILPTSFRPARAKSELDRYRSFVANRVSLHKKLTLKSNKIYNREAFSRISILLLYWLVTLNKIIKQKEKRHIFGSM